MGDTNAYPDDFVCPTCSYPLCGLNTDRCPECGYTIKRADVALRERRAIFLELTRFAFLRLLAIAALGIFVARGLPILAVLWGAAVGYLLARRHPGVFGKVTFRVWILTLPWLQLPWLVIIVFVLLEYVFWFRFDGMFDGILAAMPSIISGALVLPSVYLWRRSWRRSVKAAGIAELASNKQLLSGYMWAAFVPVALPTALLMLVYVLLAFLDRFFPMWYY